MSEASAAYDHGHIRLTKRESGFLATTLLAVGGFLASMMQPSTQASAGMVQQVAANTSAIKAEHDARTADEQQAQEFRAEVMQRLSAIDGRTIDTFHVLLDVQGRLSEKQDGGR